MHIKIENAMRATLKYLQLVDWKSGRPFTTANSNPLDLNTP